MALRPDISLAVRTANTGEAFSNALLNVQRLRGIQQQPLRNQLLGAQVAGAEQTQQLRQEQTLSERDTRRLTNIAGTATILQPVLTRAVQTGDFTEAEGLLQKNIADLQARQAAGEEVDPTESIAALEQLRTQGPQSLLTTTNDVINSARQLGVLEPLAGAGGLASAKTEIFDDGTIVQALPNNQSQVLNPAGKVVTGQERLDTLANARKSEITQKQAISDIAVTEATAKAEATQRASRVSQITSELSTRNRESKRNAIGLSRALNLAGKATQGLTGAVKLKLSRIFPDLDVSDEASLEQSLKLLSLDQLQKFKGPTTDFEFRVTEDIAGKLGDSRSANIARIKSLQRAEWFNQREFEQFIEHTKAGKSPDTFGFNFSEQIKTKKGTFSLQDIQDTAVDRNLTIEETIKRLNQ